MSHELQETKKTLEVKVREVQEAREEAKLRIICNDKQKTDIAKLTDFNNHLITESRVMKKKIEDMNKVIVNQRSFLSTKEKLYV